MLFNGSIEIVQTIIDIDNNLFNVHDISFWISVRMFATKDSTSNFSTVAATAFAAAAIVLRDNWYLRIKKLRPNSASVPRVQ